MLSKKKKDMHLSFRNDPRDIFNLQNEVRVNVRRELAKLKCNDGKVDTDSIEKLTMELNDVSIESMTSIDFSNDTRAHFRSHEGQIRDIIYTKKCWKAICCNRHLFKNKVCIKRQIHFLRVYAVHFSLIPMCVGFFPTCFWIVYTDCAGCKL